MARIPFEVENIVTITGRGVFVVARWLGPDDFENLREATLGGCPIEPWTEVPRSLDSDGNIRLDLFAFMLRRGEDQTRFVKGQRVELVTL